MLQYIVLLPNTDDNTVKHSYNMKYVCIGKVMILDE